MLQPPAEKLVPELIKTVSDVSLNHIQNKRMVEVGGKLWRSTAPDQAGPHTVSCQEPSALDQLQGWRPTTPLSNLWQCQSSSQWKPQCSLTFSQSCASVCAHCSPHLLVTLLLRQPRCHCPFFAHLVLQTPLQPGIPPGSWGCSYPHLSLWICTRLLPAHCSSLPGTLGGTRTLWGASHSCQFGVTKATEGTECPITQTINEHAEEDWTQYWPQCTMMLSGFQLDSVPLIIPLFNPAHCVLNQTLLFHFLWEFKGRIFKGHSEV